MMHRALLLAGLFGLSGAAAVSAQSVGIGVSITAAPISANVLQNLNFGVRAPGQTVDTGAGSLGNGAIWQFTGLPKSATINMTFTATNLTGPATMQVHYSNVGYGSWCTRRPAETCGAAGTGTGTFNPGNVSNTGPGTVGTATATTLAGAGNNDRILTIWVGARLPIPANAPSGSYSGTLSVTLNIL